MSGIWKSGDRVFAYRETDGYAYPATITKVHGNTLYVHFDDGQDATTETKTASWLALAVGDSVQSKSMAEDDNLYYGATVIEVNSLAGDHRALVEFEDSTREWIDVTKVRLRVYL